MDGRPRPNALMSAFSENQRIAEPLTFCESSARTAGGGSVISNARDVIRGFLPWRGDRSYQRVV